MAMPLTVVGIGEALFDRFDHGAVLGGAPVNLAVHAHQLLAPIGGRGVVASRIGDDDLGRRMLQEFAARGVDATAMQIDPRRPTGDVRVVVDDDGQPTYDITEDVAWDAIEFTPELAQLAANCAAVCFGALAQRSDKSRETIRAFLDHAGNAVRVFDVNLRQDATDDEIIRPSLERCTVAKLNEHELPRVAHMLGAPRDVDPDHAAEMILRQFDLRLVALTRGERGTVLYTGDRRLEEAPRRVVRQSDADSVGAGDACTAGLIAGLLLDWSLEETLSLANGMGAFVASRSGATPALEEAIVQIVTRPPRVGDQARRQTG